MGSQAGVFLRGSGGRERAARTEKPASHTRTGANSQEFSEKPLLAASQAPSDDFFEFIFFRGPPVHGQVATWRKIFGFFGDPKKFQNVFRFFPGRSLVRFCSFLRR